jgi:HEAT repeat protein
VALRPIIFFTLIVTAVACGRKPPYDGKSVAELEGMLRDVDPAVQAQGAFGLSRLGAEARGAVPALIEALSKDGLVRQHAALALGQIGPDAKAAVPALTDALHAPEWAVRRQAALALGHIGPDARTAIPALKKLSSDPHQLVRKSGQEALGKIQH